MLSGELPLSLSAGPLPAEQGVPLVRLAHAVHVQALWLRTQGRVALLVYEGRLDRLLAGLEFGYLKADEVLPDALYEQAKAQALVADRQVIVIEWAEKPTSQLDIMRNHQASCGLYVVVRQDRVYIHWDPVALYDQLQGDVRLDYDQCLAFLSCSWNYDNATVFRDIQCLPERAHLRLSRQGVHWQRPLAVAVGSPAPLRPLLNAQVDPVAELCQRLQADIADYHQTSHGRLACELSSGLDSALVASIAAGQVSPARLLACGYIPMGDDRAAIAARRAEAVSRLQAEDYGQPIEQTFPVANAAPRRYWPYEAPSFRLRGSGRAYGMRIL